MLEKDGNLCSAGNPATWSREGMLPPDLKQGAQFQNFPAQYTFGSIAVLWENNPLNVK